MVEIRNMYTNNKSNMSQCNKMSILILHRRRINTYEKAKVVASVWGEELIQFLAALAVLPRTILKNRMNSFFSFKSSWCNSSYNSNCQVHNS